MYRADSELMAADIFTKPFLNRSGMTGLQIFSSSLSMILLPLIPCLPADANYSLRGDVKKLQVARVEPELIEPDSNVDSDEEGECHRVGPPPFGYFPRDKHTAERPARATSGSIPAALSVGGDPFHYVDLPPKWTHTVRSD